MSSVPERGAIPHADVAPAHLDAAARARYARHLSLPGFGQTGQAALGRSRVLVVGAGGLGSPVLAYLAAAGVGELGIVDDDIVETSNLQRQVIHRESDVGGAKTASAARFVRQLNSAVDVRTHDLRVGPDDVLGLVAQYDVVVDGTDNFTTRYALNDSCVVLGVPLVWASISQFAGQLGVVVPGAGPCYRCLFPAPLADDEVPNCAIGGVLGVLPGVMGAMQAAEVVKLVTGVGTVVRDGVLLYDALAATTTQLPLVRDAACGVCGDGEVRIFAGLAAARTAPALSVAVEQVDAGYVTGATARGALVVDVREPDESAQAPTPGEWGGALHLPWSGWSAGASSAAVRELSEHARSQGREVVVVCAAGGRSTLAARTLLADEPRLHVVSLAGGMNGLAP